jgi:CubicO group peptidase (beta-lactamase class C family)
MVKHMIRAQASHPLARFGTRRRGDHNKAREFCQLNRNRAYSPRATDDQQRLAFVGFTRINVHPLKLDLVAKEPLEFKPGDKFNYSNTGYFLLGMLIEKITGEAFGEFLSERIFNPIGMHNTRVNDMRLIIPNRAHGYSWHDNTLLNGDYVNPTQTFAAGALVSTLTDMVKWDEALYTERLLKRSILEQMWTPATLSGGETANYGFGWRIDKVNGHRRISHGGAIRGRRLDCNHPGELR